MTEPKYLAVDGRVPAIIRLCSDKSCHRYHDWISLNSSDSFYEADQIARAMNLMDGAIEAKKAPLAVRQNPDVPSDEVLTGLFVENGGEGSGRALRAVWRHGCDAGMVAP